MEVLVLPLIIVGGILGAVEVFRTDGQSLPGWGVVALAAALLITKV